MSHIAGVFPSKISKKAVSRFAPKARAVAVGNGSFESLAVIGTWSYTLKIPVNILNVMENDMENDSTYNHDLARKT